MNFYKREGYDLLTYLGDLGGLFDIVFILGSIITSFLTTKLFTATLISQLYRIQNYMKDETQYYKTNEQYKFTTEEDSKTSSSESLSSCSKRSNRGQKPLSCSLKYQSNPLHPKSPNLKLSEVKQTGSGIEVNKSDKMRAYKTSKYKTGSGLQVINAKEEIE